MNEHPLDWSAIADAHDDLSMDPRLAPGFVGFRQDLARALAGTAAALAERLTTGEAPALPVGPEGVPMDPDLLGDLFDAVRASLARHGAQGAEVERLAEAQETEPDLIQRVVRLAVFDWDGAEIKEIGRRLQVPYVGLLLLGRLLALPFMHAVAGRAEVPEVAPTTEAAICPCCGAPPGLARLAGEGGARVLVCSLCGTNWDYPRIQCPFCGTRDQEKLAVIVVEEEKLHRVEVCEACKRYLKVVDERVLGRECLPFLEETRTLPLDLLAEREGYVRRLY